MVCCVSKTGGETTVHFWLLGFGVWFCCLFGLGFLFCVFCFGLFFFVTATCGFLNIILFLFLWKYFKKPSSWGSWSCLAPPKLAAHKVDLWFAFFLSCCQVTKINHLHQTEPFQKNWEGGKSALSSHVVFFNSLILLITAHLCRAQSQYLLFQVSQELAALRWQVLFHFRRPLFFVAWRGRWVFHTRSCCFYSVAAEHQKMS